MPRPAPRISQAKCRRGCGVTVATMSRPLYGNLDDFKKFQGICQRCLTPQEKLELEGIQRESMRKQARRF